MKRAGHLYDSLCSFENLYLAYRKARRGCGNTEEIIKYSFFIEKELFGVQNELKNDTYTPAPYRFFKIHDPKERLISVAPFRDRVVHHAIINIIESIFEKSFIFHSYATRKNKGTHKAILKAQGFLKKNAWFLKMDISKYFDSINHDILKQHVRKKIKDPQLLVLIDKIIDNGGVNGTGLPIGNLTSQFLANVYFNDFDHYILEKQKIGGYVRYMDDFVLFDNSHDKLKILRNEIMDYLQKHNKLLIKPGSVCINNPENGLSFLGARIYPSLLRIGSTNLRRLKKNMNHRVWQFGTDKITEKQYTDSLNSITAHLKFFDSYHLRKHFFSGQSL